MRQVRNMYIIIAGCCRLSQAFEPLPALQELFVKALLDGYFLILKRNACQTRLVWWLLTVSPSYYRSVSYLMATTNLNRACSSSSHSTSGHTRMPQIYLCKFILQLKLEILEKTVTSSEIGLRSQILCFVGLR